MSDPNEQTEAVPTDPTGLDPDSDFMETERALYDEAHHEPQRRLSETLFEMAEEFAEKFGEGARRLSEHQNVGWDEDK